MNTVKTILGGILCAIAVILLTIRFGLNFPVTGLYQLYCIILGQRHRVYWDIGNEWSQYTMDIEQWWDIWRYGIDIQRTEK